MNKLKSKKELNKLSQLRLREEKKKELAESEDYLKQIDKLPTEEGRKFVIDQVKEEDKKKKDYVDTVASVLQTQQFHQASYKLNLCKYGLGKLDEIDYPAGWQYFIAPTSPPTMNLYGKTFPAQDGIAVVLKDNFGRVFMRRMSVTYIPEYDIHAVNVFCESVEDTVDEAKGLLMSAKKKENKTKSGIYLN